MSQPPIITRHAVDRFVQRHAQHLTAEQALEHLLREAPRAAHLKARTILGHQQWRLENPDCVLVMKEARGRMVCVTVLPEPEEIDPGILESRRLKKLGRRQW